MKLRGKVAILFAVGAAACASDPPPAAAHPDRPNFVVILADDMGLGDLGPDTPNLHHMAAQGMTLRDFQVAPVCTPTRAMLLTGCQPVRVGLGHRVLFPFSTTGLHGDETTIAEALAPLGYRSACIGKWHLGHHAGFLPPRQGFDEWFGVPYSNDMDGYYYAARDFQAPPLPLHHNDAVIEQAPDQALLTRRFTDQAIEFVRGNRNRPFFLYLAHVMPHQPIAASAAFQGRSRRGLYGDAIAELDDGVGRILAELAALGLEDDTLVLFLSDNGPWRDASRGGLRGKKNSTWEGGTRVPAILRWPGRIPAGTAQDALQSGADLLPTFAALAGAALPAERVLDGRDAAPLWLDPAADWPQPRPLPSYRDDRLQAVREGRWKLHGFRPEWAPDSSPASAAPLLYDLRVDPGETTDLATVEPAVVARLLALAARFRADLGDAATGAKGGGRRPVGTLD
ncbi:MAG TPA: sulfatase [Planctomycetota bacterium]